MAMGEQKRFTKWHFEEMKGDLTRMRKAGFTVAIDDSGNVQVSGGYKLTGWQNVWIKRNSHLIKAVLDAENTPDGQPATPVAPHPTNAL